MSDVTKSKSRKSQEPLLPPKIQEGLDRAVSVWQRLPIALKVFIGAAGVTALAIAGYMALEPVFRDDAVLFTQLESEDAGAIIEQLKEQGVPYKLTGDGTTIRVPEDRVHELRLVLAADGLPRGGQVGFEGFENMRLGATEFEQHVTYRRAMEGELSRTIATVGAIRSARVHLVMPRKSVFAQKREPASASVVVKLAGGELEAEEVSSIIHLVAAAVPGLEPSTIALITTEGRVLHRPRPTGDADADGISAADADQVANTRALETMLEQRTHSMLARVLGAGHVDVRVSAELDSARVERKTETYDPDSTAMRSEQAMEERVGGGPGGQDTVAGVPGAEANLPGGEAIVGEAGGQATGGGILRKSHTRNFEVDRIQERRVSVTHDVKRLAVAVLVDADRPGEGGEMRPHTEEELTKLEALVKSAVGFDAERGDQITLQSVPFFEETIPDVLPEADVIPIPGKYKPLVDKWLPLAKIVGGVLLGLVGFFWIRRKMRRGVATYKKRVKQLEAAKEAKAMLVAAKEEKAAKLAEAGTPVDFRVEALGRAQLDPATAALILKGWLKDPSEKVDAEGAETAA